MQERMEYELIRSRRRSFSAEIRGGRLRIRAPLWAGEEDVRAFVEKSRGWIEKHLAKARAAEETPRLTEAERAALMERARAYFPARVAYYAEKLGVQYGRVGVRMQHTRWGSCSATGNLSFNALLMLAPPEVADSVVVHELCHRKHMNHSPQFYAEVERAFPEYPRCRKWLRENGTGILVYSL